ncbi:hypothetical protein ACIQJX_26770 [Streptomyces griseoviridis]|nr:hypothetical protein [Streptomyces griseoviridis]
MRASQRDAATAEAFEPLRYGARHLLATAETQLARLPKNAVQNRWAYQVSVLSYALERLDDLHERWLATQNGLPLTATPGTDDFDAALAEHHADSWSYLDDWATQGQALREVNAAAQRTTRGHSAPVPASAPVRRSPLRK